MGQLAGPTDPTADAHWEHPAPRKGFFTDTSICIGCKACEVACKEWNHNPQDGELELLESSYDNTGQLGASTWRHVAFVEQDRERIEEARDSGRKLVSLGMPGVGPPGDRAAPAAEGAVTPDTPEFRWLMSSDVCKHCTHAGCLDVCPTGALFRTEHGTVVVQDDVCNGCGTCVAGCPFGVIERRPNGTAAPKTERAGRPGHQEEVPNAGIAQKCTLCYDRMVDDETPACAKTCPTTSIKYGDHEDMVDTARERVAEMHAQGRTEARLYGANELDGVGGTGSVFLLLDEPEVYGLPPDPRVPTADLPQMYRRAGLAAAGMVAVAAAAFLGGRFVSLSEYDSFRPPEPPRRRRRDGKRRRTAGQGGGDGSRETPMVPEAEFASYYGRPVVKPAPWEHEVSAYLFLGGVAGGSALLALGGQLTGRAALRRNARLGSITALGLGTVALVKDLGRPERFYNMLRTFKPTSPMNLGSWILSAFGAGAGITAVAEVDRMTGERVPLGPLRTVLHAVEGPAGIEAAVFAAPVAAYTAVLLGDTATPTWNAAREDLPFVFVSSAALASAGLAMVTTPVAEAGPARRLAVLGVAGDLVATKVMERRMDPVAAEPLHEGEAGTMLRWSERLAIAGGLGALLGGRHRAVAVVSGTALLAASALTRFGVMEAGLHSAKDPRYTIEPQKNRLAARRAAGVTEDSITTAG